TSGTSTLTSALTVTGTLKSGTNVYAGDAFLRTSDGNVYGDAWGGYLSTYINNRCNGNMNGRAYPRLVGGGGMSFNGSWGSGEPTHIWGSQGSSTEYYVYQPSTINAGKVGGQTEAQIWQRIEGRAGAWARQEAG